MASAYDLAKLKADFERDGYVIVDGIFDGRGTSSINGSNAQDDTANIATLRQAAEDVTRLTRSGKWPHRRVVGKQFPPFDAVQSPDSWGVQHLLHPDLPHHDRFAAFYGSSPLLGIAAYLLGTTENHMQLELFNLLIEPADHCFALSWHRDDVRPDVSAEEEQVRLAAPTHGIQWNACLYDDDCLFLVPGTHKRTRTAAERCANLEEPPPARRMERENDEADVGYDGKWSIDPPDTLRVELKAGQTAFYSQRILHRASYLPTRKRATLHGCYGDIGTRPGALGANEASHNGELVSAGERARNVLQHGVEWMKEDSFGAALPLRLQPMWHNLLLTSARYDAHQLGYSLEG